MLEQFGQPRVVQDLEIQDPRAEEALVRIHTLGQVNDPFDAMHRQEGIRSVILFDLPT